MTLRTFLCSIILFFSVIDSLQAQESEPILRYTLSFPQPSEHSHHVELEINKWLSDTIQLKMPRWTPGYYQIMDYGGSVENVSVEDEKGRQIGFEKVNDNTWNIAGVKDKAFKLSYDIKTNRQFVATSYVDSARAYIVPSNTFLYVGGHLHSLVSVKVVANSKWNKIATGLDPVEGISDEFTAPDFDILYDCPILIGDLDELPSFNVRGIEHRFIGYDLGKFDRVDFMDKLQTVVKTAVSIIGDIPYKDYTFIAIGPGRGGIEHLNNATVSFDGNGLNTSDGMNRMLNFLAHEYFHLYNVKRIRPFELGPFDYDVENRTNQLWISEGLTVYYEYLIMRRAGLIDSNTFLSDIAININAVENDPGRFYQSLRQASYDTWNYGPFGKQGNNPEKSISIYDKGAVVGLVLDLSIRNATQNKKSLDDVMRLLYSKYYLDQNRGFTGAEFQQICEQVADIALTRVFEYVYTTREIDYNLYLGYAGLELERQNLSDKSSKQLIIKKIEKPRLLQSEILKSWIGKSIN